MTQLVQAAGVLIWHPSKPDYVLAISNGWNPLGGLHHWNLPCGRSNPGETPLHTALRELHEETGLKLNQYSLDQTPFVAPSGPNSVITAFFLCRRPIQPHEIHPFVSWEGCVRWRHTSALTRRKNRYHQYNLHLLEHFCQYPTDL